MRSTRDCGALAAVPVALVSQALGAELPSNRELITAMPDTIESVMVLDADALRREDCALRPELLPLVGEVDKKSNPSIEAPECDSLIASGGGNTLEAVVFRGVVERTPRTRLIGGADFPRRPGTSRAFRYLTIWITKDVNGPLKAKVESGDGIEGDIEKTTESGVDIHRGSAQLHHGIGTVFVAFPDEHMTIVALDSNGVASMIKALSRKDEAEIPARWQKAAAALDVAAPFILLRKFAEREQNVMKRDPEDLSKVEVTRVPINSFGLASNLGPEVRFRLRVISPQPADAEAHFYGGTFHGGFAPVYWKWTRRTDENGLIADVVFTPQDKAHHSSLIVTTLFGVLLGI